MPRKKKRRTREPLMSDDLLDGILRAIGKTFPVDIVVYTAVQQAVAEKEVKRRRADYLELGRPANADITTRLVTDCARQVGLPVGTLLPRRRKE